MTLLDLWMQAPAAKALGWTLVHFVWEGAAIAMALALALCMVHSSRARYAAACLAMLGMLAAFGLTLDHLMPQQRIGTPAVGPGGIPRDSDEQWLGAKRPTQRFAEYFLPWLVALWIAGVVAFELRTLASWIAAHRLRSRGVCCAPELWQRRVARLGAGLRLSRPVTLLETCLADVPIVIGYVRPVILMPVGLLTGLPVGQVESILLHELAHIRRYDYLVNLLQTSVEGLLFYHPAMWWVSGVIRAERENCCDDVVVSARGDAHEYAVALAALEHRRCATHEAALAASGGSLVKRIRRLLDQPEAPRGAATPVFSAGLLTIVGALALAAWQSQPPTPAQLAAKWLNEDVVYIITNQERVAFKRLETDEERKHFIEQFWLRRDPTPGTPENEFKDEHYRRIDNANKRFGRAGFPGWKTDRGRIYIIYGPPDEVEAHNSGGRYERTPEEGGGITSTYPFQQWRYRHIEGIGNNIIMEFVDKSKSGDFRMTSDPHAKDAHKMIAPN